MVRSALHMIAELGIHVRRQEILERARGQRGLTVRGNRVYVNEALARETLDCIRWGHLNPERAHGGGASDPQKGPTIRITSRPKSIAEHREGRLRPLTRADVIAGTKLLDALGDRGIYGTTCGMPQEAPLPLQPIEQYLIGFRYNRNGGWTDIPLHSDVAQTMRAIREIAEENYDPQRRAFAIWVPSPLRLDSSELDELLAFHGRVLRITVGSMPTMGLNGPVDPLGIYTLSLAECLGGAAILHCLYPDADVSLLPHPQPMDLHTGNMIFGTVEWNRLDLIKRQVLAHLGIPYYRKECLTSACMPDPRAQADKVFSVAFGVMYGFTTFGMYPLCADEVWSAVQCVLDVEYVLEAWRTVTPLDDVIGAMEAYEMMRRALQEGVLPAEMPEVVGHLRKYYSVGVFPRYPTGALWEEANMPQLIAQAEEYAAGLISQATYAPDEDRLRAIMEHYYRLCRQFGAQPMALE